MEFEVWSLKFGVWSLKLEWIDKTCQTMKLKNLPNDETQELMNSRTDETQELVKR